MNERYFPNRSLSSSRIIVKEPYCFRTVSLTLFAFLVSAAAGSSLSNNSVEGYVFGCPMAYVVVGLISGVFWFRLCSLVAVVFSVEFFVVVYGVVVDR